MIDYVSFRESDHSYTSRSGHSYISVTSLLSVFKQPFDGAYWSLYKAIEQYLTDNVSEVFWLTFKRQVIQSLPKREDRLTWAISEHLKEHELYIQAVRRLILAQWEEKKDKACEKGTAYHLKREHQAYQNGFELHPSLPTEKVISTTQSVYSFDLTELPDGYYAELLVYNHNNYLAGQIDKVWITTDRTTGIRYVDIDDYKSNEQIKTSNKYQKMQYPLQMLDDCSLNHYRMQISTYGWMLEQFGYKVRSTRFTHIKDELDFLGEPVQTEIPYEFDYKAYKPLVEAMLSHYQATRQTASSPPTAIVSPL
ncbi:hypothetical protein CLV58_109141 [Spirosoma oryzae]|uniref:PD-(D/E)XK nuclease superfamily protein n=1 Tax=Spirosoma oryzae TaxID=1469603 RepID=A0A2T0SYD3_9BACT|nr:hypothetical protein [Spirosoma oryzae]PRY38414.1 hypothetical protein CLV58_109141 [Spirosoma oryzae]